MLLDGHGATRVDLEDRVFPDEELDLLGRRQFDRLRTRAAGDAGLGGGWQKDLLGAGHQGGREEHEGSGAHP